MGARRQAREAAKGTDTPAIKSAVEELEQASHAFAKVLYERGAAAGAGGEGAEAGGDAGGPSAQAGGKPDDDVIEGEFEVKK